MGNRANRKEIGQLMQRAGLPRRFMRGKKFAAYRLARYANLAELKRKLRFKPGDIVNDCDGFNHRIERWMTNTSRSNSRSAKVITTFQAKFVSEHGVARWSCGCPISPSESLSQKEIEDYHDELVSDLEDWIGQGWIERGNRNDPTTRRSLGLPICDEHGFRLPPEHGEKKE